MATDEALAIEELLKGLDASDWSIALKAIAVAEGRIRSCIVGDPEVEAIVMKLIGLASHTKWEVRRAVANAAAQSSHPIFDRVLNKLARDDNSRVQQAAEYATVRRRDSRQASTLGKQHEDRINLTLDDIEARFGLRGRDAVKRAAEQIANTFARELYHEVIKLLSPLAVSAERLRGQLSATDVSAEALAEEADRIGRRVNQLRAVLDAMRTYTAQPSLRFSTEVLGEVIQEAANVSLESEGDKTRRPSIEIDVASHILVDISRDRFVQALTNVLLNAIESYQSVDLLKPITVRAELQDDIVTIKVEDSGCGMSAEAQRDALTLFATNKVNGTGFGLPLAVKIVESEHGGRLGIDSLKGRGTIIEFTIPKRRQADHS